MASTSMTSSGMYWPCDAMQAGRGETGFVVWPEPRAASIQRGPFVHLIPAVMLSGLGRAPGVPAIMGGINQTVMMALSMVIVTSMVGAGGLGGEVHRSS